MKKGINNPGFRALPSSVQNNILSNMKYGGRRYSAGGAMPMEQLTEFSNGGTHEQNGLGGIPQGMNPDGQMNLVEEGETKFDAENYVFSDSLKVDKELADAFNLSPKMVGKTFADASKMAGRKKSKREGDAIEDAANEKDLANLMEAQEAFKQKEVQEKLEEIDQLDPNVLPALMGQGQGQDPNMMQDPSMGGQMQEAPMDEQAMMEQQMMAEQQGGGQPSPEEMAMMQQQGMMRGGGPLYNTMYNTGGNISQADYLQNRQMATYDSDYRSYAPGGFMKANPCPCDTPGCPPCNPAPSSMNFAPTTVDIMGRQNTGTQAGSTAIGGLAFNPNLSTTSAPIGSEEKTMQDLRQSMLSSRGAYATTDPDSSGSGIGNINIPPMELSGINWNKQRRQKGRQERLADKQGLTVDQWKAQGPTLHHDKKGWIQSRLPFTPRTEPMRLSEKSFWDLPFSHEKRGNVKTYKYKNLGGPLNQMQGQGLNQYDTGGLNQYDTGGLNQMRSGGGLCHGCGGKMHAYGGRMDGIQPNQAKYGKWLDLSSNILGATAGVVGNLPVFGQAVGAGLGTLSGATKSLAENARTSEDGKVDWQGIDYGDMALQAGLGAGAGALGAAGSLAVGAGGAGIDALTTSKYEKKEAMLQDVLTNPEKYSEEEYAQALGRQEEMGKNSGLFNAINAGVGIAGAIVGGKVDNAVDTAGDAVVKGAELATDVAEGVGDNILPKAFDVASAATDAAKTADTASDFISKADKFASNKFVQQGASMGMSALDKADQANTEKTVADELAAKQEREMMMTNDPNSPYYEFNETSPYGLNMANAGANFNYGGRMLANGGPGNPINPYITPFVSDDIYSVNPIMPTIDSTIDPMEIIQPNSLSYTSPKIDFSNMAVVDPNLQEEKGKEKEKEKNDNEVNVNTDLDPKNRDYTFKETVPEFLAKVAAPAMNLYSGLFDKYDPKFEPKYHAIDAPKLDYTESLNAIRRSTAGLKNDLRKFSRNPGNILFAHQKGAQLEAQAIQQIDAINAKLQFDADKLNNAQKQKLEKMKKELELGFAEAKRNSLQAFTKQSQQIATTNQANRLAQQYAAMGAEDIGSVEYKTLVEQLGDLLKKRKEKKGKEEETE